MSRLSLTLLGGFQIELDGRLITTFESDRIRSLLAYLAVEADRPHSRSLIATLIWPEQTEARARTNLRHVLYELRTMLSGTLYKNQNDISNTSAPSTDEQLDGAENFLVGTRQTIQFNPTSPYTSDVKTFDALMAECEAHAHPRLETCADCMPRLRQAVALYRGSFLAGINLSDSAPLEEWARMMQERLHHQVLHGLHALTTFAEMQGDVTATLNYARQQVALEPWREEAHQQLMRALARDGQRGAVLAQFETLRQLLANELGVEPSPESVAVYERIRSNTWPAQTASTIQVLHPSTLQGDDVPDAGTFYGRQHELLQLQHWAIADRCRVVAVAGLGGMGKTALVAAFARTHQQAFDRVLWRSLINAPPLDEVLRASLQTLIDASLNTSTAISAAARATVPASLDEQLDMLLDFLRRQRCLLVLDNLESLLQAETAGAFRPGYEGYGYLIQRIAEQGHQSCLMLTTRERPHVFTRLEEDTTQATSPAARHTAPLTAPVRTLYLNGLDTDAAGAMLSARGLLGQSHDALQLAERYSRNPLALKLVSQTVHELFGGNIAAYLMEESLIFDDIRTVLDQQFSRLTPLEHDIMRWLAIEREPISFQTLRENLLQPPRVNQLVEALRSLQRRSLVSHTPSGFALQNVVMEYTTGLLTEHVGREIRAGIASAALHGADSRSAAEQLAFNRFALLKAQSREYVRASQSRLILGSIAAQLLTVMSKAEIRHSLFAILDSLRHAKQPTPNHAAGYSAGYAAGNVINLLLQLGIDLRGADFSHLCVWQAYLQGNLAPAVNFQGANMARSVFTYVFGKIEDIYFTADNNLLVVGGIDGQLSLWQAADGQRLHEYQSFGAEVRLAMLSNDGRTLASAHMDHNIRLWDVAGGQLLQTLYSQPESLWGIAFSPDSRTLMTSNGIGEIFLWDVQTGHLKQRLHQHTTGVPALGFSADSRYVASGDVDGVVCLWQVNGVNRVNDGNHESNHAIDEIMLVRRFQAHEAEVHALVFGSGDTAHTLITSGHDRYIHVWDFAGGQKIHTLKGHTLPIRSIGLSEDGYTLASVGEDQFICLWDARTGQLLHTLTAPIYYDPILKFSQDGRILAVVGAHPSIDLWDVAAGQRLDSLQSYSNHITAIAISPDGTQLAAGGSDRMIRLWPLPTPSQDTFSSHESRILQDHQRAVLAASFSPDGQTLASADEGNAIRLWDIAAAQVVRVLEGHTNKIESLQISQDGTRLVSASHDQTVRVWNLRERPDTRGNQSFILRGHTDSVRTCAISPDDRWVASGSTDRTVRLWDFQRSQAPLPETVCHVLEGHTNGVRGVAFSPDGQTLVSVSYDQTLRIWDVQREGQARDVWLFKAIVLSVAYHPNGHILATGTGDFLVSLLDARTGQLLRALRGHTHRIESLCFSPDGRWLISGSYDETVRIWDVEAALAGHDAAVDTLRAEGPYAGMNITGVTGISAAQKAALKSLGAVERSRTLRAV